MRRLLNPFWPPVTTGESKIIDALAEKLSPKTSAVILRQAKKINLVQRHGEGNEVCFYVIRGLKPFWDPAESLPTGDTETKLARVEFRFRDSAAVDSADIWLVNGHLFSMDLTCSPKRISEAREFEIIGVKVLFDPSE